MTDEEILDLEARGRDSTIAKAASVNHRALRSMPPDVRDAMRRSVHESVARQTHARAHLRWLIDGGQCIDRLQGIAEALGLGYETNHETGEKRELSRQRVKELELEASIRFKLLGKVLPELRSVEVDMNTVPPDVEAPPERRLTTRELALKLLRAATSNVVDIQTGAPVEAAPEPVETEVAAPPWMR